MGSSKFFAEFKAMGVSLFTLSLDESGPFILRDASVPVRIKAKGEMWEGTLFPGGELQVPRHIREATVSSRVIPCDIRLPLGELADEVRQVAAEADAADFLGGMFGGRHHRSEQRSPYSDPAFLAAAAAIMGGRPPKKRPPLAWRATKLCFRVLTNPRTAKWLRATGELLEITRELVTDFSKTARAVLESHGLREKPEAKPTEPKPPTSGKATPGFQKVPVDSETGRERSAAATPDEATLAEDFGLRGELPDDPSREQQAGHRRQGSYGDLTDGPVTAC